MSKTRIFISSTCYDLNQIRRDLEEFILGIGHEPILSDSKGVSIPPGLTPVESCKWLVQSSDIFVLLIGGRYGSTVSGTDKSITNIELEVAIDIGMPIYTFVDSEVWIKRPTYEQLKMMVNAGHLTVDKLKTALGDKIGDLRVFEFIDNISKTEGGLWIHQFTEAAQIKDILRNNLSLLLKDLVSRNRGQDWALRPQGSQPKLLLLFDSGKEGGKDTIMVDCPPHPVKETLIADYRKRKIEPSTLEIIKNRSKDIESLIDRCDAKELGLLYKPLDIKEFLRSAEKFNSFIDSAVAELDIDFDNFLKRLFLWERAVKPNFVVKNDGTCPGEGIVIYLDASEGIEFMKKEEIEKSVIPFPKVPSELIKLALNLDDKLQLLKTKPATPFSLSSSLDVFKSILGQPDLIRNLSPISPTFKTLETSPEIRLEIGRIRIDIDKKLKHRFQKRISNEDIYFVHSLNKGERIQLQYRCYADNLPFPSDGRITFVAKQD